MLEFGFWSFEFDIYSFDVWRSSSDWFYMVLIYDFPCCLRSLWRFSTYSRTITDDQCFTHHLTHLRVKAWRCWMLRFSVRLLVLYFDVWFCMLDLVRVGFYLCLSAFVFVFLCFCCVLCCFQLGCWCCICESRCFIPYSRAIIVDQGFTHHLTHPSL